MSLLDEKFIEEIRRVVEKYSEREYQRRLNLTKEQDIEGNNMREELLKAVRAHAEGHVEKHRLNVEVYLKNPAGIGEHSDIVEAIETELMEMAKYNDQLEILDKYFK